MSGPVRTTIAGGVGSGPQATTLVDLGAQVPCGAQLPDLRTLTADVTIEAGPDADIVYASKQPLPVLAVGYAVVDAGGRIASSTGGDASLQKVTATTLAGGRTVRSDEPALLPTGLCATTSGPEVTTTIQQRIGEPGTDITEPVIFQVSLQHSLPAGVYSAVDIVLVGTDLQHATAYRTGEVWQFETG